jgi:murein DD-endopeptidase MepM/ murein hydrolase activator NlpD
MDASEIAALDQAFAIAVEDYIGTNWGTWTAGRKLGECLVENSASISAPAKEGVITYGLEEVFYSISETASYSLSVVWDDCEQQSASESDGSDLADQSDDLAAVAESTTPELDQAFADAVADFVTTSWAGWSDGVLLGECLAANASQIGGPAKQGVIDYGLEDVYNHISRTDSYTLGIVWNTCEQDGGTTATTLPDAGSTTTAVADVPDPELDQDFSTAVRASISEGWSEGESTGDCLVANASQITSAAKRGVIDYGLGEVFNHISLTDRSSLGLILEFCGAQEDSATASSGVLAATCTLDVELAEISCQASGYNADSTLTWTSTGHWSGKTGGARSGATSWVFPVVRLWDSIVRAAPDNDPPGVTPGAAKAAGHQEGEIDLSVPPEVQVFLESCKDSFCQKAETSIDAAELMSEDTSGLERIEIILPFDFADPIVGIVPMGETIVHPIPGGHPGMDLQWSPRPEGRPEIFASATGTVTRANEHAFHLVDVVTDHLNLDVQMRHEGFDKAYFTTYGGLALDFAHELGDTVQKGELLGHIDVNPYQAGFMIHWELGYYTRFSDESDANDRRVCPMTFLDEASRALLEEVWETQPADAFNDAFPYICSNIYFGRNE